MNTGTITSTAVVGGISMSGAVSKEAEGQIAHRLTLAAGVAGEITAAGVDSLETGHGIVATDVVDVHWDDPSDGTHKCRRGLTVDADGTNSIDFDETPAGEGDALPANGTVCVVSILQVIDTVFEGDDLLVLAVKSVQKAVIDFRDAGGSELVLKIATGSIWSWATDEGFTNPLASDSITTVRVSNGTTTATDISIGALYDSVS